MARRSLARIAGTVWCLVAAGLLARAAGFWALAKTRDGRSTALLATILAAAVVVGWIKGALVLRRSAAKNLARIERLPEPVRVWQALAPGYVLLIAGMILLGVVIRAAAAHGWLGGWASALGIYVAVATALASSSPAYFRA
jgi:hypothetical protein